jgi:hypothetical protein
MSNISDEKHHYMCPAYNQKTNDFCECKPETNESIASVNRILGKQSISDELYSNFRGVTLEEVIKVAVNEGEGVEGNPVRHVIYWYTKDGELIAHNDPLERKFVPTTREEHDL